MSNQHNNYALPMPAIYACRFIAGSFMLATSPAWLPYALYKEEKRNQNAKNEGKRPLRTF